MNLNNTPSTGPLTRDDFAPKVLHPGCCGYCNQGRSTCTTPYACGLRDDTEARMPEGGAIAALLPPAFVAAGLLCAHLYFYFFS